MSLYHIRIHIVLLKCIHALQDAAHQLGQILEFFILNSNLFLEIVNLQNGSRMELGTIDGDGKGILKVLYFQFV